MANPAEASCNGAAMHVVVFPFLAFGHISPFAQLARRLVAAGSVRVTFLSAAANVPRVEAMLAASASKVAVEPLNLPPVPGLPVGAESTAEVSADGAELLKVAVDGTRPQVAALLEELRPDVLLFDFATPWVVEIAAPLGIKALPFAVFAAVASAYLMVPARRPNVATPSVADLVMAPAGFPPSSPLAVVPAYQAADFSYVFKSFHGMPSVYDRIAGGIKASDAIVLKTCREMEGPYINYLAAQFGKPVLVTGPIVPDPPQGKLDEPWASWLSSFPANSVVFASFGSETFLSPAAATELLLGLEATNRPFIVVLNFPKDTDADAEEELNKCTPPGLEERTKGRGIVHTGWVQQQHILRHTSVGCFVNHAGFSSVVEGLVGGCRLVLLPMKGDQYLNAALFARELHVGTEVARRGEDGWFDRVGVCEAVGTAVGARGDEEERKWREFFTDDAEQRRFVDDFVRELRKLKA